MEGKTVTTWKARKDEESLEGREAAGGATQGKVQREGGEAPRRDQQGLGLLRPARVFPGTVGLAGQPLL